MKADITDQKTSFGARVVVETFTDDNIEFFSFTRSDDDCECVLSRAEVVNLAEFAGFKVFDVKPMVSAEEVAAIKIVAPGAKWIARDVTGDVFAYTNKPTLRGLNYWEWEGDCRAARLPFLGERFANVPCKESLMEI